MLRIHIDLIMIECLVNSFLKTKQIYFISENDFIDKYLKKVIIEDTIIMQLKLIIILVIIYS